MDDEVKGNGNSVNYSFRMHDPRVGRFFCIDPLSSDYPHNSPYAFSENSVIAFVELEGLEKYYAADGSLIGKYGDNQEMRVINASSAEEGLKWVQWAIGCKKVGRNEASSYNNEQAMRLSNPFTEATGQYNNASSKEQINAMGKVFDQTFKNARGNVKDLKANKIGIVVGSGNVGNSVRGTKPAHPGDHLDKLINNRINGFSASAFTYEGDIFIVLPLMSDNYYDLEMTMLHESTHLSGQNNGSSWGEFNAHYTVTQDKNYDKTSFSYKEFNVSAMSGYIDRQNDYVLSHPSDTRARKDYESNLIKFETEKSKLNDGN